MLLHGAPQLKGRFVERGGEKAKAQTVLSHYPIFGVKVFLCSFLGNKMLQQNIVVSDILQRW